MAPSFWTQWFSKSFRLGARGEKKVLDLIVEHPVEARRCSREPKQVVSSVEQLNWTLVRDQAEIISRYESMADDLHREAVIQIAQRAFFAGMREDPPNLLEKLDEIADASQDAPE